LTEFPGQGVDGPEGDEAPVKIAVVTFAFNNAEIIHNLTRRGQYIKNQSWKKYEKINAKIVKRLHDSRNFLTRCKLQCIVSFHSKLKKARQDAICTMSL